MGKRMIEQLLLALMATRSLRELGEAIGVSHQTVANWARGTRQINPEYYPSILRVAGELEPRQLGKRAARGLESLEGWRASAVLPWAVFAHGDRETAFAVASSVVRKSSATLSDKVCAWAELHRLASLVESDDVAMAEIGQRAAAELEVES